MPRASALFSRLNLILLQKSTVSQTCSQDCPDFAERMKRKALRVRSEGSIPPYVTKAESRKQHSDSPLCNSLNLYFGGEVARNCYSFLDVEERKIGEGDESVVEEGKKRGRAEEKNLNV